VADPCAVRLRRSETVGELKQDASNDQHPDQQLRLRFMFSEAGSSDLDEVLREQTELVGNCPASSRIGWHWFALECPTLSEVQVRRDRMQHCSASTTLGRSPQLARWVLGDPPTELLAVVPTAYLEKADGISVLEPARDSQYQLIEGRFATRALHFG